MPKFSAVFGHLGAAMRARLTRFGRDRRGGVAAVVAIVSPVVIGSLGLGGEAGYWYLSQREVQNAADVAAHATALRANQGESIGSLQSVAEYLVGQAGVELTATQVALNSPPTQGAFIEDGSAIEVVVTETVPRLFSAIYSSDPVQISARSVATAQNGGTGCILALSPNADQAILVSGSANLNLIMCDIVSNSTGLSYDMAGSGSFVSANCVQTTGTAQVTANLNVVCDSIRQNASPVPDPYGSVPEPVAVGACQDGNVGQNNQSTTVVPVEAHPSGMNSIRYCNGLNMRGNVTLSPGLYIVEGGEFRLNSNATINGSGVVFYLRDGVEMRWNGTASLNLAPPLAGPYQGMLIFGARDATTMSHRVNGNFGTILDGAIYTPASHLEWSGNSQTSFTGCTHVVANTITFTGNGAMSIHCLFPQNTTIDIAGTVTIVE